MRRRRVTDRVSSVTRRKHSRWQTHFTGKSSGSLSDHSTIIRCVLNKPFRHSFLDRRKKNNFRCKIIWTFRGCWVGWTKSDFPSTRKRSTRRLSTDVCWICWRWRSWWRSGSPANCTTCPSNELFKCCGKIPLAFRPWFVAPLSMDQVHFFPKLCPLLVQ